MSDKNDLFKNFKSLSEAVEKEDFGEGFATVGHVVTLDGKVFEVMTTPEEAQNLAATLVRHIRARKIVKDMMGEGEETVMESDPRMTNAKEATLKGLGYANSSLGQVKSNLHAALKNVALLDRMSNSPNDKMLAGKIEQAMKMAEKLDIFTGRIYEFIEDIKI